jgi:hypothetical protein
MANRLARERKAPAAAPRAQGRQTSAGAARCRRHFLRYFPGGFRDETYVDWERGYKVAAAEKWQDTLAPAVHDEADIRLVDPEARTRWWRPSP